ncbi:competence protein ComEC [Saccharicrinis carchari]|uniref:Competence protein ComEC n=1 Tax=Saccharicrinis carchari TaxID=1168039 RepID=A0A521EP85_SACCC|nr:ComEC/Rec2 family competence protein [Saccharicrinis carchari]SMO85726.1 competence protein ComEC [Saccharicrinis carchari]
MKSINYSAIPFVRLLFALLAGRIFSSYVHIPALYYVIVFVLALLGLVFIYYSARMGFARQWTVGAVLTLMLFALGMVNRPHYIFDASLTNSRHVYCAVVKKVLKDAEDKQSVIVKCMPADTVLNCYFSALLYVRNNDGETGLLPGDKLAFEGRLSPLQRTGNPFAFEYADYMHNKGIEGQFYLHASQLQRMGSVKTLSRFFYLTREKADRKLKRLKLGKAQFGIVSALVLGDKSMLDHQTKTYFSNAGAIHILSVSGLHVGIIYLMLTFFMGRIGKGALSMVKVSIVIIGLWFYAAIAGMSPSVFRATLMFSIFVISKFISHRYNIYHSMAIAAFIILIINPDTALHAGFWLSFLAVASIVYFYPKISAGLYFSSPWAKYLWGLFSVSLSAQIGTAPLAIYLFGFFPTWFVVSNFLVIPVLPLVLTGALLVVLLPYSFIVVQLIVEPLTAMVNYLMEVTQWVGSLPNATFVGLQLSFYQVVLLYATLVLYVIWQQRKAGRYLIYTLFLLCFSMFSVLASSYHKYHQQYLVVHQINGKTAVMRSDGITGDCWVNQPLDTKEYSYALKPFVLNRELKVFRQHTMDSVVLCPVAGSHYNMMVVNGDADLQPSLLNKTDVIVLTSKIPSYQIKELLKKMKRQKLVFDSSFSPAQCRYYQRQLKNSGLNPHFVSLHGAFVLIN